MKSILETSIVKKTNCMDGKRVRAFLSQEGQAILDTYSQFATLLPAAEADGAEHRGEDGRFVEALVRAFLRKSLPTSLRVTSGFIMKPAVKTGKSGRERSGESDSHSGQLDIIVHDSANYPVFHDLEDTVIVPPEGVVAVVSVKKHLYDGDIKSECKALMRVAKLCSTLGVDDEPIRGPFLALIAPESKIKKVQVCTEHWVFEQMKAVYSEDLPTFDQLVNYIGTFGWGSIFKRRPDSPTKDAQYVWFKHTDADRHLPLQFILTGILSVFYDCTRNLRRRPGYSAFGRGHDKPLGTIPVSGLR